jgi:hypothetical protein
VTLLNNPEIINTLSDTSIIKEYILESNKVNDVAALVGLYNDMSYYFGETSFNKKNEKHLKDLYDRVTAKYPLLHSLSNYYGNVDMTNDFILYLKIKDNVILGPEPGQTPPIC